MLYAQFRQSSESRYGEGELLAVPARHKDGRPVWTEMTLRRVTIQGAARILAMGRDINDRKAAEVKV